VIIVGEGGEKESLLEEALSKRDTGRWEKKTAQASKKRRGVSIASSPAANGGEGGGVSGKIVDEVRKRDCNHAEPAPMLKGAAG